jgi:hypothetical protein
MVIDSSYNHLINIEFLEYNNKVKLFLHVQVEDWSAKLKRHFLSLLSQLGECYCLVEDKKIVKFAKLHGAKFIKEGTFGNTYVYMLRFN